MSHKDGRFLGDQEVFKGEDGVHVTDFDKHDPCETFTFTPDHDGKFDIAKDTLQHGFTIILSTDTNAEDIKVVNVGVTYTPKQK